MRYHLRIDGHRDRPRAGQGNGTAPQISARASQKQLMAGNFNLRLSDCNTFPSFQVGHSRMMRFGFCARC